MLFAEIGQGQAEDGGGLGVSDRPVDRWFAAIAVIGDVAQDPVAAQSGGEDVAEQRLMTVPGHEHTP